MIISSLTAQKLKIPSRILMALNYTGLYAISQKATFVVFGANAPSALRKEGADYMCLMGDDVELLDDGWLLDVARKFSKLSDNDEKLIGFGCVAFTSFPGMSTFPIVSKLHMELFGILDYFINQDGDPYLFQLYRRFGSSLMIPSRIQNNVGGSDNAGYQKKHAADWKFGALDGGTEVIDNWMKNKGLSIKKITLDVVVPSYRVEMRFMKPILELKSLTYIQCYVDHYHRRSTISFHRRITARIRDASRCTHPCYDRVNAENSGASASRNWGMEESAAGWIHFMDDDVTPHV